jgi:hypothetical protein
MRGRDVPLWPNFVGSLLAPTTAKWGEDMNALASAAVAIDPLMIARSI